jgi:hypothetical protein
MTTQERNRGEETIAKAVALDILNSKFKILGRQGRQAGHACRIGHFKFKI